MVIYNFKKIAVVPTASDFINITLSKTQRKTPTVVHPGYEISRIRKFYMRKVKYTQQNYHDRLSQILEEFPILDDIHPFYADLMNILYDRDHYKLALGQLNTARHLIDNVSKEYVRLLKYGDSLYRCKQLKKAALGRMSTIVKKQSTSFAYLEQVRQHLARLPSIDPNTRTLLVCGFPNVGKSSFVNKLSRANVDVQPYAFTTKSLFVGHTDYQFLRWQVIDTPGILDHPLEERNTIEMQSVTALAHLKASIIFVIDISEQCGYPIPQQVNLFNSIKPLFKGKPLIIALNKIDVIKPEQIAPENRQLIEALSSEGTLVPMSTMNEEGVMNVKQIACDKLLEMRIDMSLKGKKVVNVLNRLHVATPTPRDHKERPPASRPGTKDMEAEEEEDEYKGLPEWMHLGKQKEWKKKYMLDSDEWKFDVIPEIMDGKNIADFIDPEIMQRLEELEKEEDERAEEAEEQMSEDSSDLDEEEQNLVSAIRERKKVIVNRNKLRAARARQPLPHGADSAQTTLENFESHLAEMGIDPSRAAERVRSRSRSRSQSGTREARKRARSEVAERSRSRSVSKTPEPGEGLRNVKQKLKAEAIARKSQKARNTDAKKGEGDRTILNMKPKHLFSGKRKSGTTQRR